MLAAVTPPDASSVHLGAARRAACTADRSCLGSRALVYTGSRSLIVFVGRKPCKKERRKQNGYFKFAPSLIPSIVEKISLSVVHCAVFDVK